MRPVALITGGKRGIGRGIALALAQAGFDLALTDLDDDPGPLDDLQASGGRVFYVRCDLADLGGHATAIAAVAAEFGTIQILVNNAGIGSPERGDFLDLTLENFDTVLDTNLRGTVFFTQTVLRNMLPAPATAGRAIITITSVSAEMTSPDRLDYCLSKAALAAFSKGLALRLAEAGISVFEIRPGIIETGMTEPVKAKYDTRIAAGLVPQKRWGQPGDIGNIVASLASGAFGFATGSIIHADGGLSIARL